MIENTLAPGFYIGASLDMAKRINKHKSELSRGVHINPRLQRAWDKYGAEAFSFSVLEYVSPEGLDEIEEVYLSSCVGLEHCYNIALFPSNPNRGRPMSEEHKRRIGEANRIALQGKTLPESVRQKISEANRRREYGPLSQSTREKMSVAKQGKPAPWNAKPKTEETKRKISETKRRKRSE